MCEAISYSGHEGYKELLDIYTVELSACVRLL